MLDSTRLASSSSISCSEWGGCRYYTESTPYVQRARSLELQLEPGSGSPEAGWPWLVSRSAPRHINDPIQFSPSSVSGWAATPCHWKRLVAANIDTWLVPSPPTTQMLLLWARRRRWSVAIWYRYLGPVPVA